MHRISILLRISLAMAALGLCTPVVALAQTVSAPSNTIAPQPAPNNGSDVPEPAMFGLFVLGVGGLLVGRRLGKSKG